MNFHQPREHRHLYGTYKLQMGSDTGLSFAVYLKKDETTLLRIMDVMKEMTHRRLFLEYSGYSTKQGFNEYNYVLIEEYLTIELVDFITSCGIHKIHNWEEAEIVKKIKSKFSRINNVNHVIKTYKKTLHTTFRSIISLNYFMDVLLIKGIGFFSKKMTFSELRDIATLRPQDIKELHDRKKVFIVISSADWNGVFGQEIRTLKHALPSKLFKVDFTFSGNRGFIAHYRKNAIIDKAYSRINKGPLRKMIKAIHESAKSGLIDYLFIGGHGFTAGIDTFSLAIGHHVVESPLFKSIKECLSNDATIILISCSTGKEVNGSSSIARLISESLRVKVIAPNNDTSLDNILYDDTGKITKVLYKGSNVTAKLFP